MNNALIDDRRIKVDFSQSVSKEWNRYTQRKRRGMGNMEDRGGRGHGHGHGNGQNYHHRNNNRSGGQYNKPRAEKKYYGGYRQNHDRNVASQQHQHHHQQHTYSGGNGHGHDRTYKHDHRSDRDIDNDRDRDRIRHHQDRHHCDSRRKVKR
eukprot:66206_1